MKLGMPKKIMARMDYHRNLVHEKFMQRLTMENKMKAQDYVGSIMAYNEEKGEVKIPKEEIEANMTVLIFAGSETTSTAMTAILTQLLQSPSALKTLELEIRSAYETEDEITIASVAKLEYLTAIIQEGIRMGPPTAVGLPRVTPNEGARICGQLVPGNVSDFERYLEVDTCLHHPADFCVRKSIPDVSLHTELYKPRYVHP
jgi:cytochrome P450